MNGVISKVHSRPTQWGPMYSFQINGSTDYFGTNKTPPPPAGTSISFDEFTNARGYKEAKNIQVQQDGSVQSGVKIPESAGMSRDDYWRIKDEKDTAKQAVIELQSCRNSAIELIKLMLTPTGDGSAGLKLPAQAKREEFLYALVNKYTYEFLAQNHNKENNNDESSVESSDSVSDSESGEWDVS